MTSSVPDAKLREAGKLVGNLIRSGTPRGLNLGKLYAIISDVLPHWPEVHFPIRDLLSRPLYRQLSIGTGATSGGYAIRESLIAELKIVYTPPIVLALSVFIDASLQGHNQRTIYEDSVMDFEVRENRYQSSASYPNVSSKEELVTHENPSAGSWWYEHLQKLRARGSRNFGP